MYIFQSVLIDVGINLGGCNVGVTKHELHRTQICTMAQEVSCKRVTDHMWRNIFFDTGCKRRFADYLPESEPCHAAALPRDKKIIAPFAF